MTISEYAAVLRTPSNRRSIRRRGATKKPRLRDRSLQFDFKIEITQEEIMRDLFHNQPQPGDWDVTKHP